MILRQRERQLDGTRGPMRSLSRGAALSDRPQTPLELRGWFSRLGFDVAITPIMPGMTAPMEAFWLVYSAAYPTILMMGGRGSGKTRGLSMAESAKAKFHDGYTIAHIGSTKAQAHRCYSFVREYVGPGGLLAGDVWKTRLTDTQWRNGSHIEVLPGTINAVSGGHPVLMVIDEFDLMDYAIFQQAVGMPQSTADYASQTVLTSALYRSHGSMRELLKLDVSRVLRWSVLDAMEPCDGQRGRPTCEDAIIHHAGGPPSTPSRCALWEQCQGRVQYATGHKQRRDVLNELALADDFTWRTQYMSEDVSRAGLVYENFASDESDDGSTNVSEAAEYDAELEVYWGLDEGYEDPSVIIYAQLRRDGTLTVFDEVFIQHKTHEQFLNMGHQPRGLDGASKEGWWRKVPGEKPRGPYKKPRRVFPDPTTKQLQEQLGQRLRSRARVRWKGEPILDGVQLLRRLIRPASGPRRLVIHPRCTRLIAEMSEWRLEQVSPGVWSDDPEPNVGNMNPDHGCLVAGTLVTLDRGEVPIEEVREGDLALTRAGWQRVEAAGLTDAAAETYRVELSNGRELRGTGDHPILVAGRGWVRLDALRYGDMLLSCEPRPSSSMASGSAAIQNRRTGPTPATSRRVRPTANVVAAACMKRCGRRRMVLRSLRGTISTTSTGIPSITPPRTWSVSAPPNIGMSTAKAGESEESGSASLRSRASARPSGIEVPRGAHGIENMVPKHGQRASPYSEHVIAAAPPLRRSSWTRQSGSARIAARRPRAAPVAWMTQSGPARVAGRPSPSIATRRDAIAPVRVVSVTAAGVAPVFNLKVAGQPEFIANGVLVHNCDSLRYLARRLLEQTGSAGVA